MDAYSKIDEILQERKMSRRQLAAAANIPPTTLQSALSRKKNMTMDMLQKIADTLEVPLSRLTGVDRVVINIRTAATINEAVIQKAADTAGVSQARFLAEAVAAYILTHEKLGEKWLDENGNKGKQDE